MNDKANMINKKSETRIGDIRRQVVGMYSQHPWPGTRQADEEMGWRLRVLGIKPEDYTDCNVIELGCGTGDYALWYATNGARHVTGIDLSDGSLARAHEQACQHNVKNITFIKQDVLALEFPDDHFDYSYSVGVLMVTGDPFRGFRELVRVTKPGGIVIVSLYNTYTRLYLSAKIKLCQLLGGNDLDSRAHWGRRLFPFTMQKLNKRYHGLNYEEISYDIFALPHGTHHTASEVLSWFDETGVTYVGSFAPLRIQDYLFAFSLPEYRRFRQTFDGFPIMRFVTDRLSSIARRIGHKMRPPFPRPKRLEAILCQLAWVPFYLRFTCFTIAGRKR